MNPLAEGWQRSQIKLIGIGDVAGSFTDQAFPNRLANFFDLDFREALDLQKCLSRGALY
jgi:hypothetical protein